MSMGNKIQPRNQNKKFNLRSIGKTWSRTKARVYFLHFNFNAVMMIYII